MKNLLAVLLVASLAAVGCSKATPGGVSGAGGEGAFANDLKGAPPVAPIARGGVPDDGVKPAPVAPVVNTRGGVPDDGVKPIPIAPIVNQRGGVPDDGVKPAPVAPRPTARGGIPDDSIKPATPGAPLPKPTGR